MTYNEINNAIAEACGIISKDQWSPIYKTPSGWMRDCPDYCNDLNAMHEAWQSLTPSQKSIFEDHLHNVVVGNAEYHCNDDAPYITNATAHQRAEAFLRTIGKWEEVQP